MTGPKIITAPPGEYDGKIRFADIQKTKKGDDYLALKVDISPEERLWLNVFQSSPVFNSLVEQLGCSPEVDTVACDCEGQEVKVKVDVRYVADLDREFNDLKKIDLKSASPASDSKEPVKSPPSDSALTDNDIPF